MKIDDIIRKCIEIPGISIQRSDFSTELLLKEKEGKGSMTFFPLFPGVTIAYIFVNSPTWTAPNFREDSSIDKGPLLLNYCVTGRCEIILNNENFVYVKDYTNQKCVKQSLQYGQFVNLFFRHSDAL